MNIIKDKEFDKLAQDRHALEVKLLEELLALKEKEMKEFEDGLKDVEAKFLANAEYQKYLAEKKELGITIDNAGIKLDLLQI